MIFRQKCFYLTLGVQNVVQGHSPQIRLAYLEPNTLTYVPAVFHDNHFQLFYWIWRLGDWTLIWCDEWRTLMTQRSIGMAYLGPKIWSWLEDQWRETWRISFLVLQTENLIGRKEWVDEQFIQADWLPQKTSKSFEHSYNCGRRVAKSSIRVLVRMIG